MLNKANEYYEQDRFTEAREAYRQAFLQKEPTKAELSFLQISEQYEKLEYLRHLRTLYPESKTMLFEETMCMVEIGFTTQVRTRLDTLLSDIEVNSKEYVNLRRRRYWWNSRRASPDMDILYDDFRFLCESGEPERSHVIKQILYALSFRVALPFLEKILNEFIHPDEAVYPVIQAKIAYLRLLNNYLEK